MRLELISKQKFTDIWWFYKQSPRRCGCTGRAVRTASSSCPVPGRSGLTPQREPDKTLQILIPKTRSLLGGIMRHHWRWARSRRTD